MFKYVSFWPWTTTEQHSRDTLGCTSIPSSERSIPSSVSTKAQSFEQLLWNASITGSLPNDTEPWWPSLLHPGGGRSSSAEQSFVLGPEGFREGTLPRDTQCWGTWEHHSAVSNASIWCIFFTWPGLNQSPDLGWAKSIWYSRYQHLSLLPIVLSFSAAWCMVHFPRTVCSKSYPLYPPILNGQITVISITNLRSPTQFHLQMPVSHSEPPPTPNRLCH